MKIEKIILKCSQEEFYNALLKDFKNQYASVKNKELKDEDIVRGFSFTKKLPMKKNQIKMNVATYRVLECEYLKSFMMEYVSQTYHKVISAKINKIDDQRIEVLYGSFDEKMVEGMKPSRDYGEDVIRGAKITTKMSMRSMLKNYRKMVEESIEDEEV